ncbi:MAG: D-alanyl-D-alanine carboxypeptidase [Candidatus Colwellbacteria bacterium]|nr:D-alanyl-D-alanine carboxypeptidase [Candidatus Colwellbacteria bacterium]
MKQVKLGEIRPLSFVLIATVIVGGFAFGFFSWIISARPEELPPINEDANSPPPPATPELTPTPSAPVIEQVELNAAAAYLLDGKTLYEFRADKRWPIASVTKLMTAFVARELMFEDEVIVITPEAVAATGAAGGFSAYETYRLSELEKAMLTVSSNDAALAITLHWGEADFVKEMNRQAAILGMNETNFSDSTGISLQNRSTALDLFRLVKFIWEEEPEIFEITRRPSVAITDELGRSRILKNINIFAGRADFLGGKTGSLPEAHGNLVSIFSLPNQTSPVIIVVLGAADRFEETKEILAKL